MKDLFTIGEMAELFDMNIRTLRYYDDIGILRPEETNPDTGYRYYSTRQFERLNTIKYLRVLGMPLKKIALFFENRDVETLRILLAEQQRETREKMEELRQIERKLESRLEALDDALTAPVEVIREVRFEERQIAFLDEEIPLGEDLEYPIRRLERSNMLESVMFLGKVGVSISAENLKRRRFTQFSGIFVFLEPGDGYSGRRQCLPAGDYVTVRFRGTHEGGAVYYDRLLHYAAGRGYALAGDSVEVTLIDAGFTNDVGKYVTEIQLPVRKTAASAPYSP